MPNPGGHAREGEDAVEEEELLDRQAPPPVFLVVQHHAQYAAHEAARHNKER